MRTVPTESFRVIRLITDRPIDMSEATASTRSRDLTAIELSLATDSMQSTGNPVVGGRFKLGKTQQIEATAWEWQQLKNIMER
jgi:hypothetical protein